jgi:hypothetical protein
MFSSIQQVVEFLSFHPQKFLYSNAGLLYFLDQKEIGKEFSFEAINTYSFYKVTQNKYQKR